MPENLFTDDKVQDNKKKNTKKKEIDLIESYNYTPESNEELIIDKPSEPLEKIEKKQEVIVTKVKPILKSNKEIYESYVKELKYFSLNLNNDVIYDSSIDTSKESPLRFENDFFILYGKKYSYNGLKIQKINKR